MEEKINLDIDDFSSEPFLESILKEILEQDPTFLIQIFVAIAIAVITIVVFLKFFVRGKTARNVVLLVGLCDAGKTLLLSRLLTGRFVKTLTSIKANTASYRSKGEKGKSWTLVDVPGHDSVRHQVLEKFKASARALVFVVDSAIFQKQVKDVAELLYSLLTDSTMMQEAPALLIVCNKQDISMAKSAKVIQQQLEKELTTLRVTRSAALGSLDGSVKTTLQLGRKGKDFEFSQLPSRVELVECSVRGGGEDSEVDIHAVEKFLSSL